MRGLASAIMIAVAVYVFLWAAFMAALMME